MTQIRWNADQFDPAEDKEIPAPPPEPAEPPVPHDPDAEHKAYEDLLAFAAALDDGDAETQIEALTLDELLAETFVPGPADTANQAAAANEE